MFNEPRIDLNAAVLKLSTVTYGDYCPEENKAILDEEMWRVDNDAAETAGKDSCL